METLLSSRYIFILFALVGLLLGVGFVYPSLWWGGVIGVALLTILVIRSANFKQATLGAGLAWSVKNLAVLIWVFSVEPYAWLPVAAAQPTPLALGFFWLYGALALGLGGLVWGLVTKLAYNNFKTSVFILTLPIVWVVSELVGSFLFSILTYGEGGNITTSLSFGYIGYLLAQHKLLVLLATMGGVYALTATSVLLGSLIASSVMHYSTLQKKIAILFGVVLLLMATSEVNIPSSVSSTDIGITVAVVQTQFNGEMMRSTDWSEYRTKVLDEAVRAALELGPDYVLLPEDARLIPNSGGVGAQYERFRLLYGDSDTVLIDSRAIPLEDGKKALRAYLFDGTNHISLATDKQTLVPGGEYLPGITYLVARLFSFETADILKESLLYRRGPFTSQSHFTRQMPAILFCYESVDPLSVWRLTREREVPFVAHPISHGIFNNPTVLWSELDTMLRVQAIFNQVPIVSAGNEAQSTLYQKDGSLVRPEIIATGERWQVGLFRW